MYNYLAVELHAWSTLIHEAGRGILVFAYAVSTLVLTLYAAWYMAALAAYLSRGPWRSKWEPTRLRCPGCSHWPRVAVVYPVFNDYEILASLEKAVRMDYPDYFIIVVDDSTDELLSLELSNMAIRSGGKIIHLRRAGRQGLKAGALLDAARLARDRGARYMLVLDADFEPPRWLLRRLVAHAEASDADLVQGHQKHDKGAEGLFGNIYRAGLAGAIIFLAGRVYLRMFPIFTGAVGLLRLDAVEQVPFTPGVISEDLRWSIDYLAVNKETRFLATPEAWASGSVPKTLRAYYKQQVRWSSGTLIELLRTWPTIILDPDIPFWEKAGYLLQGGFFTQGLWVYVNTVTPFLYKLLYGVSLSSLWPLGLYVWLLGIETILLTGAIAEGFSVRLMVSIALSLLLFIYVSATIHAIGTLKALTGRGREWVVTSKRGRYEQLYRD